MADLIGQRIAGNFVYIDRAAHLRRVIDAMGPDVFKFIDDFERSQLTGADALLGATVTLVEAGASESTVAYADAAGGELLITTDSNENDGVNIQWGPEAFKLASGISMLYIGARVKISNATESDLFIGLSVTATDILGGVTDSIGFRKVDGSTAMTALLEKNSTETTANVSTLDTSYHIYELYYDGSTVEVFVDGVSLGSVATTNLCDDEEMRPSVHFLAGSAAARTCSIDWFRVIQIGARA